LPLEVEGASGVLISTDKNLYRVGEPVHVVIRNNLAKAINAPAGQGACSIVTLKRMEKGTWYKLGTCEQDTKVMTIEIPSRGELKAVLNAPDKAYVVQNSEVHGPVAPEVFEGSVTKLPQPERWKPGDPVIEVPQGVLPAQPPRPRFSLANEILDPGTYRLEVTFLVADPAPQVRTVRSREFQVLGKTDPGRKDPN
jgi:hypothetical protein